MEWHDAIVVRHFYHYYNPVVSDVPACLSVCLFVGTGFWFVEKTTQADEVEKRKTSKWTTCEGNNIYRVNLS